MKLPHFICLVAALLMAGCEQQNDDNGKQNASAFTINRGVNIAYFLSQSSSRGQARANYFTAADIKTIKDYGFDHVRIPVDEEQLFTTSGEKETDAFTLLKWTIDYCIKQDLRVVVDLHILRSHHFTSGSNKLFTDPEAQEQFYEMWRQLSAELHTFPNSMLAYELLNEPQAPTAADWNTLIARCYHAIRELEPQRVIVIGTNPSQDYKGAKYLKLPSDDDPNILVSFHYYNPFLLTHYQASWTSQKGYNGPVHYPGTVVSRDEFDAAVCPEEAKNAVKGFVVQSYDTSVIRDNFRVVTAFAKEHGLKVYCGEYGCLPAAPTADRLRWHNDMENLFDEMGFARSVWCYKDSRKGFGIIKDGVPDDDMLRAMHIIK